MKLQRTVIELELYGEKFTLRKPTFKEASEYKDKLLKLDPNDDATEIMKGMLELLGLPKAKFDELELDHVNELMQVLLYSKKN